MQPSLYVVPTDVARPATRTLLDAILPEYETSMVEVVVIPRARDVVYRALRQVCFSEMRLARAMMFVRTLGRGGGTAAPDEPPLLDFLQSMGTIFVEEDPDREIAYGMVAQPWRLSAGFQQIPSRAELAAFDRPDFVKIASNFSLTDVPGGTRVTCEIRNHATDERAARKFRPYWVVLGVGIRLVAKSWLAAVGRRAEQSTP